MECPGDPDAKADMSGDTRMAAALVPGAECWINALPDDMLLLIISRLYARQVVQTCVLSRRWRNLWRSVTRIKISHDEFDHMADTEEECNVLFKKFVNRFLMLRNPFALHDFRLWYNIPDGDDSDAGSEDANLWIHHALECNARSIEVTIQMYSLRLNPAVFTAGRFLKRLDLSNVNLLLGFFRQLEASCKELKDLFLSYCFISDVEIISKAVEVLAIDIECHFTFEEKPSISIPSLVDLFCALSDSERVPLLKNMESLETADVTLPLVDDTRQFLKSLSGVTDLDFSYKGNTLKVENNIQWCPKFNNLTTLTLSEWCLHPDLYPLIVFLRNSPNLENLTLKLKGHDLQRQSIVGGIEERSFSCEHLDSVDIVCWEVSDDDPVLDSLTELLTENGIDDDDISIRDEYF
ncbi:LOW QUALITY PROTEIN: hypothetical protein U9M48_007960 [Paspalum notatum var. saurae]|uniref:F-box domain-containing protein n=1 Tax=Paspalum notatum var. saurae TaxID=547442 RepID=A0AAQ3WCT3_PASNO